MSFSDDPSLIPPGGPHVPRQHFLRQSYPCRSEDSPVPERFKIIQAEELDAVADFAKNTNLRAKIFASLVTSNMFLVKKLAHHAVRMRRRRRRSESGHFEK